VIVIGVDPGSVHTGYGVIETDGRRHHLIECGVLSPGARLSLPEKLRHIHQGIGDLIARVDAGALAVEDVFHAANTRTALVLGHVRGVVLLAGAQAGLRVHEYPPATVKQQVTGSGRADKQQVAYMVTRTLALAASAPPSDATDALAVALCFACIEAVARSQPAPPPGATQEPTRRP
jgi:crossover junction endodeoxyribonuclease RuvC